MTQYWRCPLHRLADIVIELPAGACSFWTRSFHEPLIIGLTLCFASVSLWQLRQSPPFWTLTGSCRARGRVRKQMNGLFCANFAHSRECWKPCLSVWCGPCYQQHPLDRYPHHIPADESGFEWRSDTDHLRYKKARNGDHLLLPFQCDLCVFRNLMHWNPLVNSAEDFFLCCI
jgi:hypothetical protein